VTTTSDDTLYFVEAESDVVTYHNGQSGYMIWGDGTCIQWGVAIATSSGATVTLTKTYTNATYCLLVAPLSAQRAGTPITGFCSSASEIKIMCSSSFSTQWMTIGKLASGQY
jgi:hypothetical protein